MTKQELNRDIKRLAKELYGARFLKGDEDYHNYIENIAKPEFMRLYSADVTFEYMNLNSVKLMLRLNINHQFIAFHRFGLMIDIIKLI